MMTPKTLMEYIAVGLGAYLLFRGFRSQANQYKESEETEAKKRLQKRSEEEVQKTSSENAIAWTDPRTKKKRSANMDTMAKLIEKALLGSIISEDEELVRSVMNSIPVAIKGSAGVSYPIRKIAVRYAVNTGGKNLKADLTRLLSTSELNKLGVNKHLQWL
jgi:hypothetical protein